MPMSCKCILDRMVFKGAMTEKERDKIQRNLHERKTGKWIYVHPLQEDDGGAYKCSCCSSGSWDVDPTTWRACPWCMALMETERRQEVGK